MTFEEREEIALGLAAGESLNSIARRLDRSPSTVWREVRRNSGAGRNKYRPEHRFGVRHPGGRQRRPRYKATAAQSRSQRRARRPKTATLAKNERLRLEVQTRLEEFHSPVQIAERLRRDFPDEPEMWVSHESIYKAIYVQGKGSLRRELHTCLRTGRALRKPQRHVGERRGRIPNMINISEPHPKPKTAPCPDIGKAI